MSAGVAAMAQIAALVAALLLVQRPLGEYMARVFRSTRHLAVERAFYRTAGVDPDADQRW